jgi:hypothetical protein
VTAKTGHAIPNYLKEMDFRFEKIDRARRLSVFSQR